jgi:hypothetical protein
MLRNVQSGEVATIVRATDKTTTILVNGKMKSLSTGSIKRYWQQFETAGEITPIIETTKETTKEKPQNNALQGVTELCDKLVKAAEKVGCESNQTSYYVGIKYNNKLIAEIHSSKRGKTKLVVNSKSVLSEMPKLVNSGKARLVPESYGWTLDLQIKADEVDYDTLLKILTKGMTYRKSIK